MNYKNIGIILSFILSSQNVFSIPTPITTEENGVECLTEECQEISKKLLSDMDTLANPCENFYQFTCGNWNTEVYDNFNYVQRIVDEKAEKERLLLLTNDYKVNENLTKEEQEYEEKLFNKMKDIFNMCLNGGQNEKYGKEYLTEFINKLNIYDGLEDLNDKDKLTSTIVKLESNGLETFFRYFNKYNMEFNDSILFQNKYWEEIKKSPELIPLLKNSIKNVLRVTHSDEKIIEEKAEKIFKLDQKFNNIRIDSGKSLIVTYETLAENYPFINWKLYFEIKYEFYGINRGLDYVGLYLHGPNILKEVGNIMQETDIKTLSIYMEWIVTVNLMKLILPEEFSKAYSELNGDNKKIENNDINQKMNYYECTNVVNNIMPLSLTKFFIDKNLSKETRNETKKMLGYIKESMVTRISKMEWLDKETKDKAEEKVIKMKEVIGYPDAIMNAKYLYQQYKDIEVKDFLTLSLINKVGSDREIFDPYGQNHMIMAANAYYVDESNTINMNAAILNSPFISINSPDYLNYGAIGVLLGHELTHAFDNGGRYFDANGEKNNWWTDDDDKNYNDLSQCFIDEYNNFSLNGQYLDGNFTLRENIADNGGIARAYDAWQISLKSNPEEASERNKKLPGLSDYTLDQLFYITYGHYLCTAGDSIETANNHSPSQARVNVVLSNSEHFAKTFNCPKNSPMNPEAKCTIW